jgi:hypothetical protein
MAGSEIGDRGAVTPGPLPGNISKPDKGALPYGGVPFYAATVVIASFSAFRLSVFNRPQSPSSQINNQSRRGVGARRGPLPFTAASLEMVGIGSQSQSGCGEVRQASAKAIARDKADVVDIVALWVSGSLACFRAR